MWRSVCVYVLVPRYTGFQSRMLQSLAMAMYYISIQTVYILATTHSDVYCIVQQYFSANVNSCKTQPLSALVYGLWHGMASKAESFSIQIHITTNSYFIFEFAYFFFYYFYLVVVCQSQMADITPPIFIYM